MWTYPINFSIYHVAAVGVALFLSIKFGSRCIAPFKAYKASFRRLANQPLRAAALIACISLSLSMLLSAIRTPHPWVHDEYSYLLAADTFAHMRMANPSPPSPEHFESFHIITTPSHASKYPPGNGLALAAGQVLTGYPIVGAWIALALASVASLWMLRVWTSPQWALWGSLLITIHAPMLRSWGQSYWGGAVAFLAGALVFGGLRRVWQKGEALDATLLAVGLVLFANTRPAEGFLASIPVFISLAVWFVRGHFSFGRKVLRVALPMVCVGAFGLAGMALFNKAVTGHYTRMPYQLHDGRYSASSLFILSTPPQTPEYNHARMESFYISNRDRQLQLREPSHYLTIGSIKALVLWDFFPLAFALPLLAVGRIWRNPWTKFAILQIGILTGLQLTLATSLAFPHYVAPLAILFYALEINCLRVVYTLDWPNRIGQVLVRTVAILAVLKLLLLLGAWTQPARIPEREKIAEKILRADPTSQHLVIVAYGDDFSVHEEYVYNTASMETAPILWARDMGPEKNLQLAQHFPTRKLWLWHLPDVETQSLEPLTPERSSFIEPTR